MNTDKAYLFGLIVGGGTFGNAEDTFYIRLPYKQWGSYVTNPQRASEISRDILKTVSPIFRSIYGIIVSYETAPHGEWRVLCEGDLSELKKDFQSYGVSCEGELRNDISISKIVSDLSDDFIKRRFIAGLADTIGSTTPSHRRFSEDVQIISFEVRGFNFRFVCELCKLLHDVKCYPDQVLWNHPNFHAASNPYYTSWNKGTKVRIILDQYAEFGAFAFKTKAESTQQNLSLQQQTNIASPCSEHEVRATKSCVHPAENDRRLPDYIGGGHYLHNRHVCAVIGCEHAPYSKIELLFSEVGELINPFPVLCKDTHQRIEAIIATDSLMANREYSVMNVRVHTFFAWAQNAESSLLFSTIPEAGYPVTEVLHALAYVIADKSELKGVRVKGSYLELIKRHLVEKRDITVEIRKPDLLTPLVIIGNGRGALVGALNPSVYKNLVSISPENMYKLIVRKVVESDLR
ncbi:MAG: hypothetical protein FWE41_06100 [Coriobacteriia bacterium]|nr:hypothetical protein [Coriobacteriia bacterium]